MLLTDRRPRVDPGIDHVDHEPWWGRMAVGVPKDQTSRIIDTYHKMMDAKLANSSATGNPPAEDATYGLQPNAPPSDERSWQPSLLVANLRISTSGNVQVEAQSCTENSQSYSRVTSHVDQTAQVRVATGVGLVANGTFTASIDMSSKQTNLQCGRIRQYRCRQNRSRLHRGHPCRNPDQG